MLEVGNTAGGGNLTVEEARTHFTAWALLKSPLLIGTDVSFYDDAFTKYKRPNGLSSYET